jgi:alkanesulfonate monooxygenase SsuD/methylene tetrahydromethanopterin reductase-like flavin-dependent oxidoreductase (luciferase family)
MRLGYKISSAERGRRALVRLARPAEATGFSFALIADHSVTATPKLRARVAA